MSYQNNEQHNAELTQQNHKKRMQLKDSIYVKKYNNILHM
jgi:hypothetical protein